VREQKLPLVHTVGRQVPCWQLVPALQGRLHPPQFELLEPTSTQAPEQRVPGSPVGSVQVVEPPAVPPPTTPPPKPPLVPPPVVPPPFRPPLVPPPTTPPLEPPEVPPPVVDVPPAEPPARFALVHTPAAQT